jgi:hypothetical protein
MVWDSNPVEVRITTNVHASLWDSPSFLYNGYWVFPDGEEAAEAWL